LAKQLDLLEGVEDNFEALKGNYNEAVKIIEEQKKQLAKLNQEADELAGRNQQLEEDLREIQLMLHDQQRVYSNHISDLRSQLNDLEDATKGKFEEQIVSLQLELKLKNDQVQRATAEREQVERKMKLKLEELGMTSH